MKNLLACLTIASLSLLSGCAVQADREIEEDPAASDTDSLQASLLVGVTRLSMTLPATPTTFRVLKTAYEFRSLLGVSPVGVDFTREAVVYYAPGPWFSTSRALVSATRTGDGRAMTFFGSIRTPGRGCFGVINSKGPYFLGKFSKSGLVSTFGTTYVTDQIITPCTGTVSLNHCVLVGCPAGQVCRVVDGVDGCMSAPPSCGMVACPIGTTCYMIGDRATCASPPIGLGDPTPPPFPLATPAPGFDLSFPLDNGSNTTVTFPTGGIPSACKYTYCGSGKVCAVNFAGRPVCVSSTTSGSTM